MNTYDSNKVKRAALFREHVRKFKLTPEFILNVPAVELFGGQIFQETSEIEWKNSVSLRSIVFEITRSPELMIRVINDRCNALGVTSSVPLNCMKDIQRTFEKRDTWFRKYFKRIVYIFFNCSWYNCACRGFLLYARK